MKIKNIYKVFFFLSVALFVLGNSNGPGNSGFQVTGAPGSFLQNNGQPGTCANTGCHSGGNFNPSLSIELLDNGSAVNAYEPTKSYQVRITATAGMGTPSEYGFQSVALDNNNNQAGGWGDVGTGKHKITLGARSYVEHSTPSSTGIFEMEWIAPAIGTGNVTVFAAVNAANGNNNNTGDAIVNGSLVLTEVPISSVLEYGQEIASMEVVPNPVRENLNLQINSRVSGNFDIRIMDIQGKIVSTSSLDVQIGEEVANIDVAHLTPGLYVVQLCGNGHLAAVQMLKK